MPRKHIKKKRHHFDDKVPYSQSYGFSSSHVQMWELDHKEGWVLKNWCFQIVVLGKTLESPLDYKEIKPVSSEGNQHWIFIGRASLVGKESASNAGDLGLIPGLGRSPGEGNGYPLQYSGLVNFMDCIVYGVSKSQTRLETCIFTFIGWTNAEVGVPILWPSNVNRWRPRCWKRLKAKVEGSGREWDG